MINIQGILYSLNGLPVLTHYRSVEAWGWRLEIVPGDKAARKTRRKVPHCLSALSHPLCLPHCARLVAMLLATLAFAARFLCLKMELWSWGCSAPLSAFAQRMSLPTL
eukprot:scaffold141084_cov25-Prasinocladus_malaysianus.AAC.3